MTEQSDTPRHVVAIRERPRPGQPLYRPVCRCGQSGHLTPLYSTARAWADQHEAGGGE